MLTAIEQSIQQYRIRGRDRLQEGLSVIMGQANWNADLIDRAIKHEESKSLLQRLGQIGSRLVRLVVFVETNRKAITATSSVVRFLFSDPSIPPVDLSK